MNVHETIDAVISDFETRMEPLETHVIQTALSVARTKLEGQVSEGDTWADLAAFAFQADQEDREPWGTYFGPMGTWNMNDGSFRYSPDPRDVTPEIVTHWVERAEALSHPVMKARYADLVWDYAHRVTNKKSDVRFARTAIDSYMAAVTNKMNADDHDDVEALQRALVCQSAFKSYQAPSGNSV